MPGRAYSPKDLLERLQRAAKEDDHRAMITALRSGKYMYRADMKAEIEQVIEAYEDAVVDLEDTVSSVSWDITNFWDPRM